MRFIILSLFISLAACAAPAPGPTPANLEELHVAMKACNTGGLTRKNAVDRVNCKNTAFRTEMTNIHYEYMDLVDKLAQKHHYLATLYADGTIKTKDDYQNRMSAAFTAFKAAHRERNLQRRDQQRNFAKAFNDALNPPTVDCAAGQYSASCRFYNFDKLESQ